MLGNKHYFFPYFLKITPLKRLIQKYKSKPSNFQIWNGRNESSLKIFTLFIENYCESELLPVSYYFGYIEYELVGTWESQLYSLDLFHVHVLELINPLHLVGFKVSKAKLMIMGKLGKS